MQAPLWDAVHQLRTAEALAQLGTVSGPADAPPSRPQDEQSWTEDWIRRAKEALAKARDMNTRGGDVLRDRAKKIADRITGGARAVVTGIKNVTRNVLGELHELQKTAQSMSNAWSSTSGLFALGMILGAVWYFTRR